MKIEGHLMAYFTGKLVALVGIVDDLGTQRELSKDQLELLIMTARTVERSAKNIADTAEQHRD